MLLHVVRFHVFTWIVLHIPAQHLSLVGVASLISPPQTDMHFMGCSKWFGTVGIGVAVGICVAVLSCENISANLGASCGGIFS